MNKLKQSAVQHVAELKSIEFLPRVEAMRRTDALLQKMLNTPPDPFSPKRKPCNALNSNPLKLPEERAQ